VNVLNLLFRFSKDGGGYFECVCLLSVGLKQDVNTAQQAHLLFQAEHEPYAQPWWSVCQVDEVEKTVLLRNSVHQYILIDTSCRPSRSFTDSVMCKTIQLLYSCGHAATGPFRSERCMSPGSPSCESADFSQRLVQDCIRCGWRDRHREPGAANQPKLYRQGEDIVWDMPSRCFTDPGFQRIDPFAADRAKQQLQVTQQTQAAIHRSQSFGSFRQKWHSFRVSGGAHNTSGPGSGTGSGTGSGIGTVLFQRPPAMCCQSHRFLNMCYGRMVKGPRDDDECESQF